MIETDDAVSYLAKPRCGVQAQNMLPGIVAFCHEQT